MSEHRYRRRRQPEREKDGFDEVAAVARSAYRIASKIKDVINIETKSFMFGQSSGSPDPVPQTASFASSGLTPVTLNQPTLGDNDYQRIGDSIKIHHLDLLLRVTKPNSIPDVGLRIVVFWDESNQITSTTQLFYSTLLSTGLATLSPKDWDQRHDSRFLYDKHVNMQSDTWNGANYDAQVKYFHIKLPIGLHTQFEEGTTTINTGALKFTVLSDQGVNSSLIWQSRITYTDD